MFDLPSERAASAHTYRESLLVGVTSLGPAEVKELVSKMCTEWGGCDYHIITRNCNHFAEELVQRLVSDESALDVSQDVYEGSGTVPDRMVTLRSDGTATRTRRRLYPMWANRIVRFVKGISVRLASKIESLDRHAQGM